MTNATEIFRQNPDTWDMSGKEDFLKALGENINKIRQEKGLSFNEMALACGIEKPNLVRLANQGTNVTASTLLKISNGLGVQLSEIFDFPYESSVKL